MGPPSSPWCVICSNIEYDQPTPFLKGFLVACILIQGGGGGGVVAFMFVAFLHGVYDRLESFLEVDPKPYTLRVFIGAW